MNINEFEDRQNDWLAQEMRREGYVNNTSGLEKDHEKHENSRSWDAGAISNANEHEYLHQKYASRRREANRNVNNTNGVVATAIVIFTIAIYIILMIFMRII